MHRDLNESDWTKSLSENKENNVVLDVRTPEEWAEGIQKDALMIDYYESEKLLAFIQELDQNKTYYVYCRAGRRSLDVCQVMQRMGFLHTVNLLGGMSSWNGEIVQM